MKRKLSRIQRMGTVIRACGNEKSMQQLARALGLTDSPYLRGVVWELVNAGVLTARKDGKCTCDKFLFQTSLQGLAQYILDSSDD